MDKYRNSNLYTKHIQEVSDMEAMYNTEWYGVVIFILPVSLTWFLTTSIMWKAIFFENGVFSFLLKPFKESRGDRSRVN